MTTMLSFEQARDLLINHAEDYLTPASLIQLANQVAVQSSGQVTLLYGGVAHPDISCNELVEIMLRNKENIRTINGSDLARLLQSEDYLEAVARAHQCLSIDEVLSSRTHEANQFMFDATKGRWADVSARFAEATQGEVVTLSGYASAERTLGLVELPAILDNPDVTSINGHPKALFQEIYQRSGSLTEVFKALSASSYQLMRDLEVKASPSLSVEGKSKLVAEDVGSSALFATSSYQGSHLASGAANLSLAEIPTRQAESYIKEGMHYLDEYTYTAPPAYLLSLPISPTDRLIQNAGITPRTQLNPVRTSNK